jgi:hypothetical protein
MTALSIWQCPNCATVYSVADVATCTAPKCTGGLSMSQKERLLFDGIRRAGLLDAALLVFASGEAAAHTEDEYAAGDALRAVQNRLEANK